ncbi:AraC family transcriptional regulator [Jiella sp. KSK16Y-1]|uniref:AraC family transcriptional regulator n=1 Tax=Jiella mangrovi TaxID=2821407 RepID=A0ABS4BHW3_9HYPH|nr:AraC family transcriptional regulator [Jiella mangrovi]
MVAERCGFSSYSHFRRLYKASFGASPSADRRMKNLAPAAPAAPDEMSPLHDLHPYQNQLDPVRMVRRRGSTP